jgi:hypothetical protein
MGSVASTDTSNAGCSPRTTLRRKVRRDDDQELGLAVFDQRIALGLAGAGVVDAKVARVLQGTATMLRDSGPLSVLTMAVGKPLGSVLMA